MKQNKNPINCFKYTTGVLMMITALAVTQLYAAQYEQDTRATYYDGDITAPLYDTCEGAAEDDVCAWERHGRPQNCVLSASCCYSDDLNPSQTGTYTYNYGTCEFDSTQTLKCSNVQQDSETRTYDWQTKTLGCPG